MWTANAVVLVLEAEATTPAFVSGTRNDRETNWGVLLSFISLHRMGSGEKDLADQIVCQFLIFLNQVFKASISY